MKIRSSIVIQTDARVEMFAQAQLVHTVMILYMTPFKDVNALV